MMLRKLPGATTRTTGRALPAPLPLLALSLLAVLAAPQASQAQVTLLSNLTNAANGTPTPINTTTGSDITANTNANGNNGRQKAVAFTTGATAYRLSSVQAYLSLDSGQTGTSVLSLALYTPSVAGGSDPGTLAVSLGQQSVSNALGTAALYTFAPSSAFTLNAGTRYVLLVDYVSGSNGNWNQGNPNTTPTARNNSGYNSVTYRSSVNNGASYQGSGASNLFAINAVAAPEPGTIALLLSAGVPAMGLIRRRKKH